MSNFIVKLSCTLFNFCLHQKALYNEKLYLNQEGKGETKKNKNVKIKSKPQLFYDKSYNKTFIDPQSFLH